MFNCCLILIQRSPTEAWKSLSGCRRSRQTDAIKTNRSFKSCNQSCKGATEPEPASTDGSEAPRVPDSPEQLSRLVCRSRRTSQTLISSMLLSPFPLFKMEIITAVLVPHVVPDLWEQVVFLLSCWEHKGQSIHLFFLLTTHMLTF